MSGRDPRELLAKAAGKGNRKGVKQTRHLKEATALAELFGTLSVQLAAGEVGPARFGVWTKADSIIAFDDRRRTRSVCSR